jgi:hypothetical protein
MKIGILIEKSVKKNLIDMMHKLITEKEMLTAAFSIFGRGALSSFFSQ